MRSEVVERRIDALCGFINERVQPGKGVSDDAAFLAMTIELATEAICDAIEEAGR